MNLSENHLKTLTKELEKSQSKLLMYTLIYGAGILAFLFIPIQFIPKKRTLTRTDLSASLDQNLSTSEVIGLEISIILIIITLIIYTLIVFKDLKYFQLKSDVKKKEGVKLKLKSRVVTYVKDEERIYVKLFKNKRNLSAINLTPLQFNSMEGLKPKEVFTVLIAKDSGHILEVEKNA